MQDNLEPDMKQQTGSKWERSTSFQMPGWMNHKLESRLPVEISATSDVQMIPINGRK